MELSWDQARELFFKPVTRAAEIQTSLFILFFNLKMGFFI